MTFFDEIRAIALSNKPQAEKVKDLQKKAGMTAAQAREQIHTILFVEMSKRASQPKPERQSRLRFTIGVEIECFGFDKNIMQRTLAGMGVKSRVTGYNHIDSQDTYKLGYDGSISGEDSCEVVSPVLKNLTSLKKVCKALNEADAKVNRSCGLHVHFGASEFTNDQWRRIIVNYANIEAVIDSFMPMSRRGDNNYYCKSIVNRKGFVEIADSNDGLSHFQNIYRNDRYHKLNLMAYDTHKTIEFRQHSGTTDFEKIENWIKFLSAFLQWSISHDEYMTASSIDELPFLTAAQKKYYNERRATLNQ